jgi:hypothetical protein
MAEIIFGIDIFQSTIVVWLSLDFFTEYLSEEDYMPVRDIKRIAVKYLK